MKLKLGYLEIAFIVLAALYGAVWLGVGPGLETTILKFPIAGLFCWLAVRWSRLAVRKMIWRLRNRLIVAYTFIALVPVLLIGLLVNVGINVTAGQIAVYLVTSELENRTNALAASLESLMKEPSKPEDWERTTQLFQGWFPGLTVHSDAGIFPTDSGATLPNPGWEPTRGMVLRGGFVYGWVNLKRGDRRATAVFPLTGRMFGDLAPGIGETNIFHRSDRRGGRLSLLHDESRRSDEVSRNRLPPEVNYFDTETFGYHLQPVDLWDEPGKSEMKLIVTRTRPSAVFRAIFPPGLDWQSGGSLLFFYFVAIQFVIAELIALAIGISLTRSITGAVHGLYEGTVKVMGGDFAHRILHRGHDQLSELAVSFNRMTENLQRLVLVEKEKERLHTELEIASEVQNQLYPKELPATQTLHVTAQRKSARVVSGDYYDYRALPGDRIVFAMGDVAGKGISAALLMATIQSSFRTQLRMSLERAAAAGSAHAAVPVSTSQLVSHINQHLHAFTSPEKFATMFLGVYDEGSSTLVYTNAGHLPPLLLRNGQVSRLGINGLVIGAFSFSKYEESRITLEPGDLLVFFTDGVSEAENEYAEMYGEDRLEDLVARNAHLNSDDLAAEIIHSARQWTGSEELQDDMTLLLVRRI